MAIDMENPTGYTAQCEVCDYVWEVSAADADREADWPEHYWQSCQKCGSDKVFAMTEEVT